MNYDKNVANTDLNALFDCKGNEISSPEENIPTENCPLAMVYAVSQRFKDILDPEVGLAKGTIFAELDLPFKASEGGRKC